MPRKRIVVRIRGEAYDILMKLSKRYHLNPQAVVESLLINYQRDMYDDMLCHKEFFRNSVAYSIELPFCFPYECEVFKLQLKDKRRSNIYIERVPKRYVRGRLPFKTLITIVIELTENERQSIIKGELKAKNIGGKLIDVAFELLKYFIVGFRRITNIYYNIGVIEPPVNSEEFKRRVEVTVRIDGKIVDSYSFMPVKEDSIITVGMPLEKNVYKKILEHIIRNISNIFTDPLEPSWSYLDAAIISYYKEQWNLAILQGVIAMESALSNLVFNTIFKSYFIKKYRSDNKLREKYKNAQSLTNKIRKFLFPLLKDLGLNNAIKELREIMNEIAQLYRLRSSIVHEGVSGDEKSAKRSCDISRKFLALIDLITKSEVVP